MRNERTTPRAGHARRIGLIATTAALTVGVAVTAPAAYAGDAAHTLTAKEAKAAGAAVLKADVGGTAWYIDKSTNTLVVKADSRVSDQQIADIKRAAGANADAIRIVHVPGTFRKLISGGDTIETTEWRCSLGFSVRSGSTYYFLTAGHCTDGAGTWYDGSGNVIGSTEDSEFPGNDYGLVRWTGSGTPSGTVGSQDITGAGNPSVGESVDRRGSTTGVHGGTVTGLNATVNYGSGEVVEGLIDTNVCAEPGDSGGPLYSGSTALGLTSGGSGDCTSGGETFFQPVEEALSAYGVSVY